MARSPMASNHLPVCCCGDSGTDQEDPRRTLLDTICGFYVEALDRLPIHDYPNLVHCLFVAGHCYGLLEPVSNIILHAIAQHGRDLKEPYEREDMTTEFLDKIHKSWYWLRPAERSLDLDGLTTFLMSWYRYLTADQPLQYLCLAKAVICLAMDLVEQEFHAQCLVEEVLPAPSFDDDTWILTVKDSLMYATMAAEHPKPDGLVALATEKFGPDHADKIAVWLHDANQMISVDDMYNSLLYGRSAPDGQYLYSLRLNYPDDTRHGTHQASSVATSCQDLNTCIHRCSSLLKENDASPCDYIKRIEALLVDYIHALHLSAISRLSQDSAMVLHHGLVVAGYLYGPLEDPIINILLNAIWYQLNFPAGDNENCVPSPPVDMICTDRMLRNGFNALMGQVVFLCSKYSMLSGHDAMEYLYFTNCNLRVAAEAVEGAGHHAVSSSDLSATEAAVKAMKHPRQAAMMSFMNSFTPALEAKLCDLLPAKGHELSSETIQHISMLLYSHATIPILKSPPAVTTIMHQRALAEIAQERRAFQRKRRFLMDTVRSLLDENYKVDTICAVARSDVRRQKIYHVNFLATRADIGDTNQDKRVLFFAQIFLGVYNPVTHQEKNFSGKNWIRSFCCPVTISAFVGRCFLCEFRRAKIVHPICVGMEYYGRQEAAYLDFMNYVSSNPHSSVYNYEMESDFVYFDPSINSELASYLNECARKEEEMTDEEAYEAFLKSIPLG